LGVTRRGRLPRLYEDASKEVEAELMAARADEPTPAPPWWAAPAPLFVGLGRGLPSGRLDGHLTATRGCGGSTRSCDPREFVVFGNSRCWTLSSGTNSGWRAAEPAGAGDCRDCRRWRAGATAPHWPGSGGGSWDTFFILQLAQSHLTRRLFGQILRHIERLTWHPTW